MSGKDRQLYLTATVLDQAFLDWTAQDNLTTNLEMVCEIDSSTGTIRASDRNKYVGDSFYQARLHFPTIKRQIAHWLSDQIEFSGLTLELNNADGAFNHLELAGADYSGFVGKRLVVKVGLRDVASTYTTVFTGVVTQVGGAGRTVKSLVLTARDRFQNVTANFPVTALTAATYPNIEQSQIGKAIPVIYGDWTTDLNRDFASVPVYCVNGRDALTVRANNAQFVISVNANQSFDVSNVYIFRGNLFTAFNAADIVNVNANKNYFEIVQNGVTVILPPPGTSGAGVQWQYESGDNIFVRVVGKAMGAGHDNWNAVAQARDLLKTYGGLVDADFDANWAIYEATNNVSYPQSAIALIKSRIWVQSPQSLIAYVQSLMAQVRMEIFLSRADQMKLNSLHFEDWIASPSFTIKNWDVVKDTFKPAIDERNNFNRARALFDRDPSTNDNARATGFYSNGPAIAQSGLPAVTKEISFPNLYVATDVQAQLVEILRLASALTELIDCEVTSRSFLRELGDWVKVSVKIGSTVFDNVPAMVRMVGYDPAGLKLPTQLWSMQAFPFPGWAPGYAGLVGGSSATITAE